MLYKADGSGGLLSGLAVIVTFLGVLGGEDGHSCGGIGSSGLNVPAVEEVDFEYFNAN
ncbi:hypothetical protein ACIQMY_22825 [Streptomyces sp. NPDC091368]|uniref:hypothetical protein n=1 Tax=Streptomyces sp. NPDC091368 TaxID=3365993 RepID=UPI0037FAEBFE